MIGLLRRAPITALLLVAVGALFLVEQALGGSTRTAVLVLLGANVPELVWQGEWWRLLACMFLHIGLAHLLLNGWALFQLGSLFETWMGSRRMAAVYFTTGLAASLTSLMWGRAHVSAGASGAIFGLMGALIAVLLRRRDRLETTGKQLLGQLVLWAVINVVFGLTRPGIDNAAHLGGAAAGFLIGLALRPLWERELLYPSGMKPAQPQ